jgi:thiamine-monophosphate kinase
LPAAGSSRAAGIARGVARLARLQGCALIGGNVSAAREWSITITALGEAPRPRSRVGARPGDALVICGELGNAASGLRLLRKRDGAGARGLNRDQLRAVRAQRLPAPLVSAGLLSRGAATAAIDVSDGFVRDLQRLCGASGVGAEVRCEALPVGAAATLEEALSGGEDYALLFSVPRGKLRQMLAAVACVEVGLFTQAPGVRLAEDGVPRALPAALGSDHLARRRARPSG